MTVKSFHARLAKLCPLFCRRSETESSADDQTLMIPETPLVLQTPHQTIPCCLLPELLTLHSSQLAFKIGFRNLWGLPNVAV